MNLHHDPDPDWTYREDYEEAEAADRLLREQEREISEDNNFKER
jgi:hypothetical protein